MRIAFFGSPEAALPSLERLLEAGHSVELVVTQPDKPAGRGKTPAAPPVKRFALERGLAIAQPAKIRTDAGFLERLAAIAPDVNVVVAYGQIMPASVIYLPRLKSINVHFSLLPMYRGAAPVEWAILNGDLKTGVTLFELNERLDEGDILSREEVEIGARETAGELEARLARLGADLLVRTLAGIERLPRLPQDHSRATLAPKLKKESGHIDWTKGAAAVERMVRAFSPWPGAFSLWGGQRLLVHAGRAAARREECGQAGRLIAVSRDGLEICCGGGTVYVIERLQRENNKAMEAAAFVRGAKIEPGVLLE
jgi:methionyl-tRNA formyltransferase